MTAELIITSALLGVGLAMDAFSVSIANGLADRNMNKGRMLAIAGTFAAFQFVMPMTGWAIVKKAAEKLEWFRPLIPWIALALLAYIGAGLIRDGIKENRRDPAGPEYPTEDGQAAAKLTAWALFMQGVATSIDALSVGFTTVEYDLSQALLSSFIIGAVTLAICMAGLKIGRRLGELLKGRASMAGGIILIAIGLEIWAKGVFF